MEYPTTKKGIWTMNIYLTKTNKRVNSTLIPNFGNPVYAHLKEECNLLHPILILQVKRVHDVVKVDEYDLNQVNYAYIPAWNRYYWLDNITFLDAERVELTLSVDVLASYRTAIATSKHWFSRTPGGNTQVYETEYAYSKEPSVTIAERALFENQTEVGIYLDVSGQATPSCNPTTSTYFMTIDGLQDLLTKIYKPETYDMTGAMDLLSQTICNPSQYIVGCRVGRQLVKGDAVSKIKFGWKDIDVKGAYSIPKGMYVLILDRTITFPDSLNYINYEYEMYIPTVGQFVINRNQLGNGTFKIKASIDMANGAMYVDVTNSKKERVFSGNGQALVPMQISGIVSKLPSIGGLVTAGSKSLISGAISAITSGTSSAINSNIENYRNHGNRGAEPIQTPIETVQEVGKDMLNGFLETTVKTIGGSGTLSEMFVNKNIIAYTKRRAYVDGNLPVGRADSRYATMTDNGYYRVLYSDLKCRGLTQEKNMIMTHLHNGIIYE